MREQQPTESGQPAPREGDGQGQFHPEVRVEESEVRLWGIVGTLVAFAAVFIAVGLAAWWIIADMEKKTSPAERIPSYSTPREPLPLEPRLEVLDAEREDEFSGNVFRRQLAMERVLHSYGRAPQEGFVQIPIEEAMRIAAKQLPVRDEALRRDRRSYGLLGGGEPNSGRVYLGAPTWFEAAER